MSWRARSPNGRRPTRRMARSCSLGGGGGLLEYPRRQSFARSPYAALSFQLARRARMMRIVPTSPDLTAYATIRMCSSANHPKWRNQSSSAECPRSGPALIQYPRRRFLCRLVVAARTSPVRLNVVTPTSYGCRSIRMGSSMRWRWSMKPACFRSRVSLRGSTTHATNGRARPPAAGRSAVSRRRIRPPDRSWRPEGSRPAPPRRGTSFDPMSRGTAAAATYGAHTHAVSERMLHARCCEACRLGRYRGRFPRRRFRSECCTERHSPRSRQERPTRPMGVGDARRSRRCAARSRSIRLTPTHVRP